MFRPTAFASTRLAFAAAGSGYVGRLARREKLAGELAAFQARNQPKQNQPQEDRVRPPQIVAVADAIQTAGDPLRRLSVKVRSRLAIAASTGPDCS
jgi:hypothetical protein